MTVFEPSTRLRSAVIDPHQRVNYTLGMVLGVDDFVQESTWHSETLRQALRDLIGYGTVRGLSVRTRPTTQGQEVLVSPGVALTQRGEIVRVPAEQCATINEWLRSGGLASEQDRRAHREAVDDAVVPASPLDTGTLALYVVLDWAECTAVPRPIPGEPCRREDDVLVDSRVKDGFALSLELRPPQQIELEGIRGFLEFLERFPVQDEVPAPFALLDFLEAIRTAASTSPAGPLSLATAVPPGLVIPTSRVAEWRRAALRLYVTELRSNASWLAPGQNAIGDPPTRGGSDGAPSGVLLAQLNLRLVRTLDDTWQLTADADAVSIDDRERPFLVPADLLKEAALLGAAESARLRVPARPIALGTIEILASTTALPLSMPGTLGSVVAQEQGDGSVRVVFTPLPRTGVGYGLQVTPVQSAADAATEQRIVSIVSGPTPSGPEPSGPRMTFLLSVRDAAGRVPLASLRAMSLSVQISAFSAEGL